MKCSVRIGSLNLAVSGHQSLIASWRSAFENHLSSPSAGKSVRIGLTVDSSLPKGAVEHRLATTDEFVFGLPAHVLDATATSFYYRAGLPVLRVVSAAYGYRMFHAGLVSADRRGVLFLGPSGSGKTTLAAALLSCGAAVHTDDQVLMWYANGKTYWDGLRRPLNLRPVVARAFFDEDRISTLRPYLPTSDKLALDVWRGICAIPDPVSEIAHCIVLGSSRDWDARDDAELRDLRTHLAVPIDTLSLSLPGVSSPADFRLRVMDRLKGLTHVGIDTRN